MNHLHLPSRLVSRVLVLRLVTAIGEPCPAHSTVITLLLDRLPGSWQPPEQPTLPGNNRHYTAVFQHPDSHPLIRMEGNYILSTRI